jgi:hypothetical protein
MSGVNGQVIMSGCGDDNPDDERREAARSNTESVSRGADGGGGGVVIGVSERQCYRIKAKVTERGAKGVVHGNRGRRCKRKTKEKEVRRVVELAKGKYRGFNDRHLTEKLAEQEKLEISREKVRQILRSAGIASP